MRGKFVAREVAGRGTGDRFSYDLADFDRSVVEVAALNQFETSFHEGAVSGGCCVVHSKIVVFAFMKCDANIQPIL